MKNIDNIDNLRKITHEMREWRQHLHQYPETAFEENNTSLFLSNKLKSFGLDNIHQGLAKTGVVAVMKVGTSKKSIGLRADIDALDIMEENTFSYKSKINGKMHACGHDGHTAMLLGAAKYLKETKNFDGTVYFIFQPAEEIKGGGKKMIEDGLFNLFPADSVYAMHNIPNMPAGHIAVKPGPMMASMDNFEIKLFGTGGHAAMPKPESDIISAAAKLINRINAIIKDEFNESDPVILSFTNIHAGNSWNIFPEQLAVRGTLRCFNTEYRNKIINKYLPDITNTIANDLGLKINITLNPENPGYPVTFNTERETLTAQEVAIKTVGKENVNINPDPWTASEDFGLMLQQKPGCYLWIGNGPPINGGVLHNCRYNFNDDILPIGAAFWVNLVEHVLKKG